MSITLLKQALNGHKPLPLMWREQPLKDHYDVVIIGGGVHGLATAYYLAKNHGLTDVAVLDKRYIGGGGSGRGNESAVERGGGAGRPGESASQAGPARRGGGAT